MAAAPEVAPSGTPVTARVPVTAAVEAAAALVMKADTVVIFVMTLATSGQGNSIDISDRDGLRDGNGTDAGAGPGRCNDLRHSAGDEIDTGDGGGYGSDRGHHNDHRNSMGVGLVPIGGDNGDRGYPRYDICN